MLMTLFHFSFLMRFLTSQTLTGDSRNLASGGSIFFPSSITRFSSSSFQSARTTGFYSPSSQSSSIILQPIYYTHGNNSISTGLSTIGIIIIACIFGTITLFLIGLFIYFKCCKKTQVNQGGIIFPTIDDLTTQRRSVLQNYFNTEKAKRNNICHANMSEDEFECYRNNFQISKWNFHYVQNGTRYDIVNFRIQMSRIQEFYYELTLNGTDELGDWILNGYYINTVRGIEWWAMKKYSKQNYPILQCEKLIYEGAITGDGNYYGRWYYVGLENIPDYHGEWFMETAKIDTNPQK